MNNWKRKIEETLSEKKKMIFVGVHCRRTDYENHYKVVSGSTLVDQVYFDKAFDIYRSRRIIF